MSLVQFHLWAPSPVFVDVSFYGLIPKDTGPAFLFFAAKLIQSHNSFLVSLGSIISSTENFSAVLKGDLTWLSLSSISFNSSSGLSDFSKSDLYAASIPPSSGKDPQSPDGHANLYLCLV